MPNRRPPLLKARSATAMLEFAMLAPVFLSFMYAIFGAGINGFYQYSLDEALRYGARQVQINASASQSGVNFTAAVCAQFIASDCATNLTYNVQSAAGPAGFSGLTVGTLNSNGMFPNSFMTGASAAYSVSVLAQVAYPIPFTIPFNNYFTGTGSPTIMAVTTVLVEPK